MKIFFWNIENYSKEKLSLLNEVIEYEKPDIFCVAEGLKENKKGYSYKENCKQISNFFETKKYQTYYTPELLPKLNEKSNFNKNGLKIFYNNNVKLKSKFEFSLQRKDGRIIILKTYYNFNPITLIFIHNISLSDEKQQKYDYVLKLKEMIELGKIADNDDPKEKEVRDNERIIIIGDFNMPPWEQILNNNGYVNSSFFHNHNLIKHRTKNNYIFYNPIVEYISNTKTENLGGSYYKKKYGWALLDYVLYNTNEGKISFEIISKLKSGKQLLNTEKNKKHSFLNYNLDHLPIEIIIL